MTEREPTFSRCPGDKRVDRIAHRSWRQVLTAGLVALLLAACGGGDVSEDPRREPLAVTTTAVPAYDRDDLYRFFAIAFGAAPGVTYMGQLVEAATVGRMSIKEIVNVFTTKSQFLETYPASLTNQEYAQKLVDNVVGTSANAAAKAEAVADIVEALKLPNWTRGDITYAIFNNLAKKPADDAKWAGTAKKMANQVAYARHYTETMKVDTTVLTELRAVVKTESCPTRFEPGGGPVIPARNEPGGVQRGVVCCGPWWAAARGVDHRLDGDRHERGAGSHARAGAAGAGWDAGAGVPACRG